MGSDCPDPKTYEINGMDFTIEYFQEGEKQVCRCCIKEIKTKTAYYLQSNYDDFNCEIEGSHWYCHKCFKKLKQAQIDLVWDKEKGEWIEK